MQVFLQLAELAATQCLTLALVGVDAFDGDELGSRNAWQQQVSRDGGLANVAREVDDSDLHVMPLYGIAGW